MDLLFSTYDSPIGILTLLFDANGVVYGLNFGNDAKTKIKGANLKQASLPAKIKSALDNYFNGANNAFNDLELFFEGTDFQKAAWNELRKIPYGKTISYAKQCANFGNPKAVRAVGGANNKNPIAIIIPCHRVIGKNGKMVGFGGGIDVKESLLALEAKARNHPN